MIKRLVESTKAEHIKRFGQSPDVHIAAPGRVNLIGEHVDYNDGLVLPMAIERHIVFAASRNDGPNASIQSLDLDEMSTIDLRSPIVPEAFGWDCYVRGMLAAYQDIGFQLPGMNVTIKSSLPVGAGLSSSAALSGGTGLVIETLCDNKLPPRQRALMCQATEHRFAGVPCGIMDPFASTLGIEGALILLDCRTQEFNPIRLGGDDPVRNSEVKVLIVNSNVKHELSGGEYAERRQQCEAAAKHLGVNSLRDVSLEQLRTSSDALEPVVFNRAHHVITEIQRTRETAGRLSKGEWERAGELMYQSHASLRDDFDVSCNELDELVRIAEEIGVAGGVFGARMTGGGFGGCTVWLVAADRATEISVKAEAEYAKATGIVPSLFITGPAAGAHVIT